MTIRYNPVFDCKFCPSILFGKLFANDSLGDTYPIDNKFIKKKCLTKFLLSIENIGFYSI